MKLWIEIYLLTLLKLNNHSELVPPLKLKAAQQNIPIFTPQSAAYVPLNGLKCSYDRYL